MAGGAVAATALTLRSIAVAKPKVPHIVGLKVTLLSIIFGIFGMGTHSHLSFAMQFGTYSVAY
jgi:hypothetical protein